MITGRPFKPTAPFLDWRNPLASGLVHLWPLFEFHRFGRGTVRELTDIASGFPLETLDTSTLTMGEEIEGRILKATEKTANSRALGGGTGFNPFIGNQRRAFEDLSIVWLGKPTAPGFATIEVLTGAGDDSEVNHNASIFALGSMFGDDVLYYRIETQSSQRSEATVGVPKTSWADPERGLWMIAGVSNDAKPSIYLRTRLDRKTSASLLPLSLTAVNPLNEFAINSAHVNTVRQYGSADVSWVGVWRRALSVDELDALYLDPFQLLREGRRRRSIGPRPFVGVQAGPLDVCSRSGASAEIEVDDPLASVIAGRPGADARTGSSSASILVGTSAGVVTGAPPVNATAGDSSASLGVPRDPSALTVDGPRSVSSKAGAPSVSVEFQP